MYANKWLLSNTKLIETILWLILDWNTWNYTNVWKLFVLDKNTSYKTKLFVLRIVT